MRLFINDIMVETLELTIQMTAASTSNFFQTLGVYNMFVYAESTISSTLIKYHESKGALCPLGCGGEQTVAVIVTLNGSVAGEHGHDQESGIEC
jgi:hypothetical protein